MHPFAHFLTITKHRHAVIRHCFACGIGFQGLFHDLSKYSPFEFIPGARYYQGTRSPNERERESKGYSSAWMHHKGRNRHHFEYWTDFNKEAGRVIPIEMPRRFLVEMFCDRVAASKIYRGKEYTDEYPLTYFNRERRHSSLHPNTEREIEFLLTMLKDKGEKATFSYIRHWVRG